MRNLVYSAEALESLTDILEYIARESGNVETGEHFAAQLQAQCQKLSELPGTLGRARSALREGMRSTTFKGYAIFFRYHPDIFEVIHILEGHRDIASYFADDI